MVVAGVLGVKLEFDFLVSGGWKVMIIIASILASVRRKLGRKFWEITQKMNFIIPTLTYAVNCFPQNDFLHGDGTKSERHYLNSNLNDTYLLCPRKTKKIQWFRCLWKAQNPRFSIAPKLLKNVWSGPISWHIGDFI